MQTILLREELPHIIGSFGMGILGKMPEALFKGRVSKLCLSVEKAKSKIFQVKQDDNKNHFVIVFSERKFQPKSLELAVVLLIGYVAGLDKVDLVKIRQQYELEVLE